jgi:malate dehydrogenase (oxaloacetate-decarboxylating)
MEGADIFIGLSRAGLVTRDMVAGMNRDAVVFGLANPDPEIMPPDALAAGAKYVATGRFDFPNTVNNLLAFPGIVKGAMRSKARHITLPMKLAAIKAISAYVPDSELSEVNLLPNPLDMNLSESVAAAVAAAAEAE